MWVTSVIRKSNDKDYRHNKIKLLSEIKFIVTLIALKHWSITNSLHGNLFLANAGKLIIIKAGGNTIVVIDDSMIRHVI